MMTDRFKKQLDFFLEIDKVKNILRMTSIADGSRRENDAEHSWSLAIMAFLFVEY
ncbi:MAG: HD domain-containing protein, partial [Turicibacter sp.]